MSEPHSPNWPMQPSWKPHAKALEGDDIPGGIEDALAYLCAEAKACKYVVGNLVHTTPWDIAHARLDMAIEVWLQLVTGNPDAASFSLD